jgi:hypothetical protein
MVPSYHRAFINSSMLRNSFKTFDDEYDLPVAIRAIPSFQ